MKFKEIFIFTILAFLNITKIEAQRRTVGGKIDENNLFPHHVYLLIKDDSDKGPIFCGGSAIDKNWILTAAHCVSPSFIELKAFENPKTRPSYNDKGHKVGPTDVFIPENYHHFTLGYDIALIYVAKGLRQETVKIPTKAMKKLDLTGKLARIGGFGYIDDFNNQKPFFEYIELPIESAKNCAKSYQDFSNDQICLKTTKEKATCRGDSGGGLIVDINNESYLVGLVSYGKQSCQAGYPVVFAKVSSYLDWIERVMENKKYGALDEH